jgi:polyphosphate glucokinase
VSDASSGFGIDIGGSGIKGAPVDLTRGELATERIKVATPQPSTPKAVAEVVASIVEQFGWDGAVGITYPGVVQRGFTRSAANVDRGWLDLDADKLLTDRLQRPVRLVNDADAAGVAEMRFGVGAHRTGLVMLLTFGTGIGAAMFWNGTLIPNCELGHIEIDGRDAEERAAARVREDKDLSWSEYAERVSTYLNRLHALVWPELFIIGGGVSRKAAKWLHMVKAPCEVVAAELTNDAGIVGAAMFATEQLDG